MSGNTPSKPRDFDRETVNGKVSELLGAGRTGELRDMMQALAQERPEDAFVRFNYGMSLSFDPETRVEAIDEIKAAIELEPDEPQNLARAASLMFDLGELDLAEEYVRRAGALVTLSEFVYGSVLVNVAGKLAAARGEDDRARTLLEGAVEAEPDDRYFALDLARFLMDHGDDAGARGVAIRALSSHPDDTELRKLSVDAGWRDAACLALRGDTEAIRCPVNDDDDLRLDWQEDEGAKVRNGRLYCPSCGSEVFIEIGDPD